MAQSAKRTITVAALLLVMLAASLDQMIVATALPRITHDLGGSAMLPWVVTAYLLTATVAAPVYGKLGDLMGRKRVLLTALALFIAGSALCGASVSIRSLVVFRALQGLGGGGLIVVSLAMAGDIAVMRDRARILGLFGGAAAVSTVAGPFLGGVITEFLSWRWIFYVSVPIGALAAAAIAWSIPGTYSKRSWRIDYAGGLLLSASLGAFVVASLAGRDVPGLPSPVLLLGLGVAAAIAFVLVEMRVPEPIVPLHLFRNRAYAAAIGVSFLAGIPIFAAMTFAPVYWQSVQGLDPARAGLAVLPLVGGMLAASIASGQLSAHINRYRVFPITGSGLALVGMLMLGGAGLGTPAIYVACALAILGIGLGMTVQILVLLGQGSAGQHDLGAATASVTMFRAIGGLVGLMLLGRIYASALSVSGPADAVESVFAITAVAVLAQSMAAWTLVDPPDTDRENQRRKENANA
ncbi:MFS transporter [Nitratireductor sp. ZSWI3]|uniref:MFS transporter n=1 Tax=Nitratireductor sp. ZSWI3 TaxID=2966359 RepID=UPI00214F8F02|nr:MFS transporter [Nitratireductor sp. ZSWI3]MCR4265946.1 MFS transporter [Nitratireductor sp. ZSWI3]